MEISKLNFYSVGTVAANKVLSSDMIEVVPLEDTPFANGELTDNATKYTSKGQDDQGQSYNHEIETTVTVPAKWLAISDPNRMTAPDVERGATVILYRFSDDPQIWWTTLQLDMKLRRLETVIFGIKATPNLDEEPNHDNMYWVEWSSHRKLIHLHTSKANGEYCAYDIQINAGDGCIVIQDDQGNYFSFDSKNHRIEIMNQDGSHVDINKEVISMTSSDSINLETETINMKATTINMTSSTTNIKADTVNSEATWQHTGTISSTGAISTQAGVQAAGVIKSDTNVMAGGISLNSHTHRDGDSKEGNVGPPQ